MDRSRRDVKGASPKNGLVRIAFSEHEKAHRYLHSTTFLARWEAPQGGGG